MAQSCGYPDTMNKKESYSPLKKTKADRLSKRLDRLEKRLEKSGIEKSGNAGYTGDSRREMRYRKTDRKAGAAAGYGNMDEAKSTAKLDKTLAKKGYKRSPLKKKKKPNKDYDKLADLLSVDTAKDTIIGPSKSLKFAQQKGHFYGPRKDSKSIKNKGNIEYYTIHKK